MKKGYDVPRSFSFFTVKVSDLSPYCRLEVQCKCDFCGDTFERRFCKVYGRKHHSCGKKKCKLELQKEVMLEKYGHEYGVQCPEIRKKMEASRIEKHGYFSPVTNPERVKEFAKRRYQTILETMRKRYGVDNPMQIPGVIDKVLERGAKTRYLNGTTKTSKSQMYLYLLIGGELNYPFKRYNIDIALVDEKIAVEYNGWYHINADRIHGREPDDSDKKKEDLLLNDGWKLIYFNTEHDDDFQNHNIIYLFEYAKVLCVDKVIIDMDKKVFIYNNKEISFEEIL